MYTHQTLPINLIRHSLFQPIYTIHVHHSLDLPSQIIIGSPQLLSDAPFINFISSQGYHRSCGIISSEDLQISPLSTDFFFLSVLGICIHPITPTSILPGDRLVYEGYQLLIQCSYCNFRPNIESDEDGRV